LGVAGKDLIFLPAEGGVVATKCNPGGRPRIALQAAFPLMINN